MATTPAYESSAQQPSLSERLSTRATSAWETTRREATAPRLAAAGAALVGAAAIGYLWDAGRRERLSDGVRDLSGRVSDRIDNLRHSSSASQSASAQEIQVH